MRLIFFLLILTGCASKRLSKEILKNVNTNIDSLYFLKDYPFDKDNAELFIISKKHNWVGDRQWAIISNNNGTWRKTVARLYAVSRVGESPYTYTSVPLKKEKGDSIVRLFFKCELWKIKTKDEGCAYSELKKDGKGFPMACSYSDGPTYELYTSNKGKVIKFEYYVPHYWETANCCPGNKNRQAFIKCFDAISALFDPADMKSKPR